MLHLEHDLRMIKIPEANFCIFILNFLFLNILFPLLGLCLVLSSITLWRGLALSEFDYLLIKDLSLRFESC
jgi:hypothetical protein